MGFLSPGFRGVNSSSGMNGLEHERFHVKAAN